MTSTWTPLGIDSTGTVRTCFSQIYPISAAGAVTSVTSGTGITVGGTATAPVVSNAGVLSVSAGLGIGLSGSSQAPTIRNTGVLAVQAGQGISIQNTDQLPEVNNEGVLSVTAGSNISVTGTSTNPVVNMTGIDSNVDVTHGGQITVTSTGGVAVESGGTVNFAASGNLVRSPTTATATNTTPTANGRLVLLTFNSAVFDTHATNPAKVTVSNSSVTAGTSAVRATLAQVNNAATILYTIGVTNISAGQFQLWFYDPIAAGNNLQFTVLVEVLD